MWVSKRAVVVGLSVGGLIAQGLAALHPERCAPWCLSDTAHKIGNDELWNARIETVTRDGIGAMADAIMERWFTACLSFSRQTPISPATPTC